MLFGIENPRASHTKLISFFERKRTSSAKSRGHLHSQYAPTGEVRENRSRLVNQTEISIAKKISKYQKFKVLKNQKNTKSLRIKVYLRERNTNLKSERHLKSGSALRPSSGNPAPSPYRSNTHG